MPVSRPGRPLADGMENFTRGTRLAGAAEIQASAELLRACPHVRGAHAARVLIRIEARAVVLNRQLHAALGRIERHRDVRSSRVPGDIRQGFLRHPQRSFRRARSQQSVWRNSAQLEFHLRPGPKPDRFAELLERSHQTRVLQRLTGGGARS